MEIAIEELNRYEGIVKRMAGRDCHCGHCEDLRWMLTMFARVARREIVYTNTEREYQEHHKEGVSA